MTLFKVREFAYRGTYNKHINLNAYSATVSLREWYKSRGVLPSRTIVVLHSCTRVNSSYNLLLTSCDAEHTLQRDRLPSIVRNTFRSVSRRFLSASGFAVVVNGTKWSTLLDWGPKIAERNQPQIRARYPSIVAWITSNSKCN